MINLNQYSEIIIWGASLSPNEIGGGMQLHMVMR